LGKSGYYEKMMNDIHRKAFIHLRKYMVIDVMWMQKTLFDFIDDDVQGTALKKETGL
jgi:hypothetical protein